MSTTKKKEENAWRVLRSYEYPGLNAEAPLTERVAQELIEAMVEIGPQELQQNTSQEFINKICALLLSAGMWLEVPASLRSGFLKQKPDQRDRIEAPTIWAEAIVIKLGHLEAIPTKEWLQLSSINILREALNLINPVFDMESPGPRILVRICYKERPFDVTRKYLKTDDIARTMELWKALVVKLAQLKVEQGIANRSKVQGAQRE